MKKCSLCKLDKPFEDFHKSKNGYRSQCKSCRKPKTKEFRDKNKKILCEKQAEYYLKNKINIDNYTQKWREKNKDKVKKYSSKYKENNKKELSIKSKKYRENNKDKVKQWDKNNKLKNPHKIAWRRILNDSLKRLGKKKEDKTIELLAYSALDLKNHISSLFTEGMSWENHGEWHIDHKIPVSKFPPDTPLKVVNALSNLQPLWAVTKEINGVIYKGNLNKRAN